MSQPPVVPRALLLPFVLITSLFALWGFANAVTDPMVTAFKKVLELDNFQASLVQLAFYGGYFTMAFPAALFIRSYSYKAGIYVGLSLYAVGALLFYPAAMSESFAFFLAGLYILTFGLAFLETTANPYILSMGDPATATRRLNLAQAFNPVGLIGGLIVAQQLVIRKLQSDDLDFASLSQTAKDTVRQADLMVIRDPYVVLGLVVIGILVVIAANKMPERKDASMALPTGVVVQRLLGRTRYVWGVVAQAFYVGAQIMCWTYIYHYAETVGVDNEAAAYYQFVAFMLFFAGRFVCTFLLRFVDAGKLLTALAVAATLFTAGTVFLPGLAGLFCLVFISFCMSLMFPTIYGIALQGLPESEVKVGAAGLVMAIVGGALMPTLQGLLLDLGGTGYTDLRILGVPEVNFSFMLPLVCFLFIAWYGFSTIEKKHA